MSIIINIVNQFFSMPDRPFTNSKSSLTRMPEPTLKAYSITETPSATFNSEHEPIVCFDINCTYPFGDPCLRCYFALMIQQNKASKDQTHGASQWESVKQWVEDVNVQKSVANAAGRMFVAGADERDVIQKSDKTASSEENSSKSFNEKRSDAQPSDRSDTKNTAAIVGPAPPLAPSLNLYPAHPSSPNARQHIRLSPWLNELFDNTLSQHRANKTFTGGAEETTPTRDPCPYCFKSLALVVEGKGMEELHVLKCKYAHEERDTLELWLMRERGMEGLKGVEE